MTDIRDALNFKVVSGCELREGVFAKPTCVVAIDPDVFAKSVYETRKSEWVRCSKYEFSIRSEMTAHALKEAGKSFEVLDQLSGEYDIELLIEVQIFHIALAYVVASSTDTVHCGFVQVPTHDGGGHANQLCVHPVRTTECGRASKVQNPATMNVRLDGVAPCDE